MLKFGSHNGTIKCSFCEKPEYQVRKLVAGPGNVYICDECIELCSEIIEDDEDYEEDIEEVEKSLPKPKEIYDILEQYVVGQEEAKKTLSVAVYNHYKRVNQKVKKTEVELQKSNILMIGPTGSGKTLLAQTLANILNVPLAIVDANAMTEAGYVGEDVEDVMYKLLQVANGDIKRAEKGIVYIDEIDKISCRAESTSITRDVSGEGVQQALLKIVEGTSALVPPRGGRKHAKQDLMQINTENILFICGGAFPDLTDIIKERLNKSSSMGFVSDLKDKYDDDDDILSRVTSEDLRKFGMIPEFLGRMPIICTLQALNEESLVEVLTEPKNAITKQYRKLLAYDEVDLEFEEDALYAIAKKAIEKKLGARGLRSIIEEFMLDIMYEIPKDDNIGKVVVTRDYVEGSGGPHIEMRTQ